MKRLPSPEPGPKPKREYLARDAGSPEGTNTAPGYYRRVAESVEPTRIFEGLSVVKQVSHEGCIRKNRGAAFVSILSQVT